MTIEFFTPRKKWYQSVVANLLLLLALMSNGLLWYFWLARLDSNQLTVYSPIIFENPHRYAYFVPGVAFFLLVLNFTLFLTFFKKIRALAYVFLSTAFFLQVMFLLVTIFYLISR